MDFNALNQSVLRLIGNGTNIISFLKEFTVGDAGDVSITYINADGSESIRTFSNISKMQTIYALLGGSSTQRFKVADAEEDDEAINKSSLDGFVKYATFFVDGSPSYSASDEEIHYFLDSVDRESNERQKFFTLHDGIVEILKEGVYEILFYVSFESASNSERKRLYVHLNDNEINRNYSNTTSDGGEATPIKIIKFLAQGDVLKFLTYYGNQDYDLEYGLSSCGVIIKRIGE